MKHALAACCLLGMAVAVACSSSSFNSDAGVNCGTGAIQCGDTCTVVARDPQNCGSCGKTCAMGEVCSAGMCASSCGNGTITCGNECVDNKSDPRNCGACGKACAANEVCMAGACATSCAMGTKQCGMACVNTSTDRTNCGSCGKQCGALETCVGGTCVVGIYREAFVKNELPVTQCTDWKTFRTNMVTNYQSVRIYGSASNTSFICNDPQAVAQIAASIKNNTSATVQCNGHAWSNCNRGPYSNEIDIDPPSQCPFEDACWNPGTILWPCAPAGGYWGGVGTATCSADTQSITLEFQ